MVKLNVNVKEDMMILKFQIYQFLKMVILNIEDKKFLIFLKETKKIFELLVIIEKYLMIGKVTQILNLLELLMLFYIYISICLKVLKIKKWKLLIQKKMK